MFRKFREVRKVLAFRTVAQSQRGSAIVVVLLLFMMVMLLAGTVMEMVFIEHKAAIGNSNEELARQAADAGVAVARDVLMNYLTAGQSLPLLEDIYLNNGCRIHMSYDVSHISEGKVVITSRGFVEDGVKILATRAAVACVRVGYLPNYILRAGQLQLTGAYYASVAAPPINGFDEQNWDVDQSTLEGRLSDDPENPDYYPRNGQPYAYFENQWRDNHPYFNLYEHIRSGRSAADYTWSILYPTIVESEHDMDGSSLEITPFYRPWGYMEVISATGGHAPLGLENGWNNCLEPAEMETLFDDHLPIPCWGEWDSEAYYQSELVRTLYNTRANIYLPDKNISCKDFLKTGEVVVGIVPPACGAENINRFRQLACLDPGWQYLNCDSEILRWNSGKYEIVLAGLEQTCIFIDCPAGDTVVLNYHSVLPATAFPIQDWLAGDIGPFFEQIQNQHKNVLVVSPADLEVIVDSRMFSALRSDVWLYFISSGNVTLNINPAAWEDQIAECQDMHVLVMAGQDLRLNAVDGSRYSGLLSAAGEMVISIRPAGTREEVVQEPYIQFRQDQGVADGFPETWSYLGMGAILSYCYIH